MSKDTLDRALDAVIGHELRRLNSHLPKERISLSELLRRQDRSIKSIDGSTILLKQGELEELAKAVPVVYHDRLKLPMIVIRRMELGKSVYTVAGGRIEQFIVEKILRLTNEISYQMYQNREPAFLYRPQVSELLRKFHSLVVIAFGIPKELLDYAPSRD